MKRTLGRTIRAQLRDMRVLFHESQNSLILFAGIVLVGGVIFHLFYRLPGAHEHPPFVLALHATFALIFFEIVLPFPEQLHLQVLYFIIPILGLGAIADGLIRFGVALINKQERGQKWQVAMASTYSNHVIICGIGKVGYRVALELLKFGRDIVAIDANPDGRFVDKAKSLGIPVTIADARRTTSLIQAGVERADAIIPCTDDELANVDIGLNARELNSKLKVVLRMFDPDLARRVEKGFGIHTAFSTSALAAPIFAAAAMRLDVKYSFYVGEDLLNITEMVVAPGSQLVGWTVGKLEADLDLSVVCLGDGCTADLHPRSELTLKPGDKILLMAALETLRKVSDMNSEV